MIYYDINDIYIYTHNMCTYNYIYTHETGDDLKLLWILANWWTNRTSRGHWKWWWITTSLVGCYSHAWLLFSTTGKMIWIWKHTDTTMHNQQSLELETLQQCSPVRFTKKETLSKKNKKQSILSIHSCSRAKAQFKPFWCKNLRWHLTILLAAWGSMDTYQIVRFVVWFPFSPKQLDDFIMFGLCGGDEQSINSLNSISDLCRISKWWSLHWLENILPNSWFLSVFIPVLLLLGGQLFWGPPVETLNHHHQATVRNPILVCDHLQI